MFLPILLIFLSLVTPDVSRAQRVNRHTSVPDDDGKNSSQPAAFGGWNPFHLNHTFGKHEKLNGFKIKLEGVLLPLFSSENNDKTAPAVPKTRHADYFDSGEEENLEISVIEDQDYADDNADAPPDLSDDRDQDSYDSDFLPPFPHAANDVGGF